MSKQLSIGESNVQLVEAFNDAVFVDDDLDRLDELVAPDVVQYESGEISYEGLESMQQYFQEMHDPYSDIEMEVIEMVGDDERVMYNFRMSGTGAGEIQIGDDRIDIAGKKLSWDGFVSLEIDDGKIVEATLLSDEAGFLRQLGVLPSQAA